jgi:hypothetical protein
MKKYIFAIVCLLSSMTGFAQDALTIENSGIKAGETGILKVILTNTEKTYINCQFDFTLPAGLDVQRTSSGAVSKKNTCALTDRTINEEDEWEFNYTLAEPSKGLFRVTMYNDGNFPFMGNSGDAIMTLKLTASSEFAGGEGKVSAIVVTDVERNSINMSDAAFTVSNTTGIKDVNADGAVKGTYKYVGKDGNLIIKTAAGKEFNAIGGRTK